MRADRLLSILMYLQTRGRTTTDRLAEEFEVSRRTIIRDVYALRVAGFPVYTERGPHGGCYLHEEYRNTLTQLTSNEIAALFLSNMEQPLRDLGLSDPLRGALLKLTAALSDTRQEASSRLTDRIVIDSTPWPGNDEPVGHLHTLYKASMEDQWVSAEFARSFGVTTKRRIAPIGVVAKAGTWFLVWAGEDGRFRVDRTSQVKKAQILAQGFDRPADFSLERFWHTWIRRQEVASPGFEVKLRVRASAVEAVKDALGAQQGIFYSVPTTSDEWVDMDASFLFLEEARRSLLALGGAVEVLEHVALRMSIADFASQISRVYPSKAGPG